MIFSKQIAETKNPIRLIARVRDAIFGTTQNALWKHRAQYMYILYNTHGTITLISNQLPFHVII